MNTWIDGPASDHFEPVKLLRNEEQRDLSQCEVSDRMREVFDKAPRGSCVFRGIPCSIDTIFVLEPDEQATFDLKDVSGRWLVFVHTADIYGMVKNSHGFYSPMRGEGGLNEHVCTYVLGYADGSEHEVPVKRRFNIGAFTRRWGENCFHAVAHTKPRAVLQHHEQTARDWGHSQTRVDATDSGPWVNWLYAWQNPEPGKIINSMRVVNISERFVLSAVTAGSVTENPLRWNARDKAVFALPSGTIFDPALDENGNLKDVQVDLGQVISAEPKHLYPHDTWNTSSVIKEPELSEHEILVEYTAHPDAVFTLGNGTAIPLSGTSPSIEPVAPARRRVKLRVVDKQTRIPVPVRLHIHGEAGEYLPPVDRHRRPNAAWFEDYSVDCIHHSVFNSSYINGETMIDLPETTVYVDITKGFEIRPIRAELAIDSTSDTVTFEVDRVLPWRENGWITADTHVHFLSTGSALLEGSGEGVNVVNLLASQWGELMTNVGDFDGKTTWGSKEAGGDGEYLVRVGTENRQHVLGHISLLGYEGGIIAPMTTGGPDESALGDPIEILLTEWAVQCKKQGGLVVLPHFPNPRAEPAAVIATGNADGVEMTSWGNLYGGIDPYSLSDWYRYLNCGLHVAAVGGTDKMSANTPVGAIRTYARIRGGEFTYSGWMDAVRRMETFVTYGPLIEMTVEGRPIGSMVQMPSTGGTVTVEWSCASVTVPMTRAELVVNGEILEGSDIAPESGSGSWTVKVERSSWMALLVRGQYNEMPEVISAHTSPVIVPVDGSPFYAAADMITILDQIEGSLVYLDTIGTRTDDESYRRMRMILQGAYNDLHVRMHAQGDFHEHSGMTDHEEHHP